MHQSMSETHFLAIQYKRRFIRATIALITGGGGLVAMLSAIVPQLTAWSLLLGTWPVLLHRTRLHAQTLTVVLGFFLLMLSYNLARGKRQAWRMTLLLLLCSAVLQPLLREGSLLATVVAVLLALGLGFFANCFQVRSDPPSVVRGYLVLMVSLGLVIGYAVGGVLVLYNDFEPLFDRFGVEQVLLLIMSRAHLPLTEETPAFFFEKALPPLCMSALLYGMVQLGRPVAAVLLRHAPEQRNVADIVRQYGTNSISYFVLDAEKHSFFSASGTSVIRYVVRSHTAVVAGDPIGPEDELPALIEQFIAFCQEQDWSIVFWQVRAEYAPLYHAAGLHLLKIGEEAMIPTRSFTLKGGAMANVRTSAKRAEKEGMHILFYQGKVTDTEQLTQIEQISRTWLTSKGGTEMRFSMGHFDPQGDKEQIYALSVDSLQRVHAFVSFVPIYARQGWGLDLMRRSEHPAPGTMELILARSIAHLKGQGAEVVSLGLAPLSNVHQESETFLDTSLDVLSARFGNPARNHSLFLFKKKFQPTWERRYLVYSDTLSLPKIGLALYQAHHPHVSLLVMLRQALAQHNRNRSRGAP